MPGSDQTLHQTARSSTPRIAITTGEPSGIGPDLVLSLTRLDWPVQIVAIGDSAMLGERAAALDIAVSIDAYSATQAPAASKPGSLTVEEIPLDSECIPGVLNAGNARYVIRMLERACQGCIDGEFDAMLTAPVHKGIINDAGIPFSGHTEFLAEMTGSALPVMMLVTDSLRVALLTTHLPLLAGPGKVTVNRIESTVRILHDGLARLFGIPDPSIAVLGLNPHAGESGHLGTEEIEIIAPALDRLRSDGIRLTGPLPADTAFTGHTDGRYDAYLAMYHDQGLPVLKTEGFGSAVNITLGLPIIRTSVDHGTALDLAATGTADPGSMVAALLLAARLAGQP